MNISEQQRLMYYVQALMARIDNVELLTTYLNEQNRVSSNFILITEGKTIKVAISIQEL